jgi:hypothetical protein
LILDGTQLWKIIYNQSPPMQVRLGIIKSLFDITYKKWILTLSHIWKLFFINNLWQKYFQMTLSLS